MKRYQTGDLSEVDCKLIALALAAWAPVLKGADRDRTVALSDSFGDPENHLIKLDN